MKIASLLAVGVTLVGITILGGSAFVSELVSALSLGGRMEDNDRAASLFCWTCASSDWNSLRSFIHEMKVGNGESARPGIAGCEKKKKVIFMEMMQIGIEYDQIIEITSQITNGSVNLFSLGINRMPQIDCLITEIDDGINLLFENPSFRECANEIEHRNIFASPLLVDAFFLLFTRTNTDFEVLGNHHVRTHLSCCFSTSKSVQHRPFQQWCVLAQVGH